MAERKPEPSQKDTVKDGKTAEDYLREKARSGIGQTVQDILNDKAVKEIVAKTVVKQSIETGVFLSFLLIGMLTLVNVAKTLSGVTWQADLAIGLAMVTIGGLYMIRALRPRENDGV